MSKLYKLTDVDGRTYGGTQWGPGICNSGTGKGGLCGPGFIHAYEHPLIAVLMNPAHAGFRSPRMWEAEGEIAKRDGQLKCGCVTLTTLREIPLPDVTVEQRVRFAILCAKTVYRDAAWTAWADGWLTGKDRSADAAWAAADAAWAADAARAAANAAEAAWANAARAAADADAADAAIDLFAIAEKAVSEP